jgi:hypothetical protein
MANKSALLWEANDKDIVDNDVVDVDLGPSDQRKIGDVEIRECVETMWVMGQLDPYTLCLHW